MLFRICYTARGAVLMLAAAALTAVPLAAAVSIQGVIQYMGNGQPLPGVEIKVRETGQSTLSDELGRFQFEDLGPGTYVLEAGGQTFQKVTQTVRVAAGAPVQVVLETSVAPLAQSVVVSASPYAQETFKTYHPTLALDSLKLEQNLSGTLAESLKEQPGVHVRAFGPGSARPVIRGFDGDRVLVLQDGARVGDISSQSGDHGVPIDPGSLERIEVVRGPASLLYGSNAIGGVVNTVTTETGHTDPFRGVIGHARFEGGTVNGEAATNAHADIGLGHWVLHAGGGARRSGDYASPLGDILNSGTRTGDVRVGGEYVQNRYYLGLNYNYSNLRYGLPFAGVFEGEQDEEVDLRMRRHTWQVRGAVRDLQGPFKQVRFHSGFNRYRHEELEEEHIGNLFSNNLMEYQVFLDQRRGGRLSGTLGVWGTRREFESLGKEALAPHTVQNSFALFAYEELSWEKINFQFGGRLDHTRYRPEELKARDFTGFSGSLGLLAELRPDTILAATYALAYRAPALEELYNHGPHVGTLSFEVGNDDLERELGNGLDLSIRHRQERVRAEFTYFYFHIRDFIFGAPTGDIEDNLPVVDFTQGHARFTGFEASLDLGLQDWLWLNLSTDYVHAELTATGDPLPRIPPYRGRAGLQLRHGGFSLEPQLAMASKQDRVFGAETVTAGYAVTNLRASYSWDTARHRHTVTAALLNAGDVLYRNHLSFIKNFAPEYGRNFKVGYTFNFF